MDTLDYGLSPVRDYLTEDLYQVVCSQAVTRKYTDGEVVHARGDNKARLCIVASGTVKVGRYHSDGSFNLLIAMGPGSHFGDVALHRNMRSHNAFCVGECQIHFLDAATLEALIAGHPDLGVALWRCNAARLNILLELYDDARTLSVTQRLAKAIHLHAGLGGGQMVWRALSAILRTCSGCPRSRSAMR